MIQIENDRENIVLGLNNVFMKVRNGHNIMNTLTSKGCYLSEEGDLIFLGHKYQYHDPLSPVGIKN